MENKEFEFLKGKALLLASASPRRRELLGNLGIPVELATLHDVDESYPDTLALPISFCRRIILNVSFVRSAIELTISNCLSSIIRV